METSTAKTSPVLRILPSMTDFAFLMPLIFIFQGMHGTRTLLGDADTGWHIRTGEWILRHGQVPHTDMFSYTATGQQWFAWEWLWDVAFAWMHQRWGMAAVVVVSALVISLVSAVVFRLASRMSGNPLIAIAFTFLAVASSSIHFLARPHLFTLLFTAIFYTILTRVRESGQTKWLWWLPAMTVLWTNLHGGWFMGVVLAGLFGAGELLSGLFSAEPGGWEKAIRRTIPYAACAFGCLAASFIGPYTYHLHVHIWEYLTDSFHREHIQEMLPINLQNPAARYLEVMLLAAGGACFWLLRRKQFTECLLLVFFGHVGLIAARNIPLLGIVAAPILSMAAAAWIGQLETAPVAAWLQRVARGLRNTGDTIAGMEGYWRTHLVSAAALALITAIIFAPSPPVNFRARFDGKDFPAKALASLTDLPAQSRIFTSDQWGDFLIYNLYPKNLVFIDGRSDFYGRKFEEKYLDILTVKYTWQKDLDEYGVDTILLPTDTPLVGALKESSRWRVVYDDGFAIVFRTGVRPEGAQVSAAINGGKDRDRKITNTQPSDRTITKTKT